MNRVFRSLRIVVLFISLSSCAAPAPAPIVESLTPTSAPLSIRTSPVPTDTAPAISASMPAADIISADFTPVLYGETYDANTFFLLLGGVRGDVWLSPEMTAAQLSDQPAWDYDIYTLLGGPLEIRGQAPQFSPANQIYSIGTAVTLDEVGIVGVRRGWPVLQRQVEELAPENELYRQILLDWLAAEGIAAPELGTLQILRVDLEGDGIDEIFLSATHLDESQHTTRAGDYSIILMRKVAGNEAVTLSVVGDVYYSQEPEITFPNTYSLTNFIDLNQDGVLEVVVDIQRWEGDGAIVYQVDGQDIIETGRVE